MATPAREMYLRPTAFEVASETRPNVTYNVTLPSCTCPDFRYRRTHPSEVSGMFCKHLRAAFEATGWQSPAAAELARRIEQAVHGLGDQFDDGTVRRIAVVLAGG